MIKLPLKDLREMSTLTDDQIIPYIHPNPAVRWLFWEGLQTMIDLSVEGKRVMDFGSGAGVLLPSLSKEFEVVHALDLNTKPLHYVKDKYNLSNVKICKSHGEIIPYKDNFFDNIYVSATLEHFKDSSNIQDELKRVLKPTGIIIVLLPTENIIYNVARFLFYWRKKPKEHYVDINKIVQTSMNLFFVDVIKFVPFNIPLFVVYRGQVVRG